MSRMQNCFKSSGLLMQEAIQFLFAKYRLKNAMVVPRLTSVHLSVGAGRFFKNSADMEKIQNALSYVACQKAVLTVAKKSVASFDVREGMKVGVLVSLRGKKMFSFLDRLKLIYLPRLRDFKGLKSSSFNGKTYNFGLKDSALVFPEVIANLNTYDFTFGLNVTMVFSSCNLELQKEMLEYFGFPFEDSKAFE